MSEISAIVAAPRERVGKGAARATRRDGLVPCVIYGGKQAPVAISIDPRIIWAELKKPGFKTRLFDIDAGAAGKHRCLARDVQFHPVNDQPQHIDFMRISADALVHVKVPVHVVNADKAPGVKHGGVVSINLHEIEVTCTADVIPTEIVVDISGLEIGGAVHVNQLALPAGVVPYHQTAENSVVLIAPPTVQSAEAAAAAASEAAV